MRKAIAFKTLLRSPLKTLLTFFLIAAASFALFSRVTDYAVTTRETGNAKGLYHAVASLKNEVPDIDIIIKEVHSENYSAMNAYSTTYKTEDKPWPTKEELAEFTSLPGVTLADTRYTTAGLVDGYKRAMAGTYFLFEGTYDGYADDTDPDVLEGHVRLKFDNIKVIAGEKWLDDGTSVTMQDVPLGEMYYAKSTCTRAFYDGIKKGSRCLIYANNTGSATAGSGVQLCYEEGTDALCVIDGLPDNYLETESFACQKGWAKAADYSVHAADVVYTKDMRAIPSFNDQRIEMIEGRPLTEEDTNACVVSSQFLDTCNLSVGDSCSIQLGDKLCHDGEFIDANDIPEFGDPVTLTIIGVYSDISLDTIYVPSSLLPVDVPADYKVRQSDFSVFVEDAGKIEAFHEDAQQFAEKVGLDLRFSDKGWLDVKDSFEMGEFTSLLTLILYLAGTVLALYLAVYLYIGRNKKSYAIMRMLGVPARAAEKSVLLPFVMVSVLAVPIGGAAGLYYAQGAVKQALANMASSAPEGYVANAQIPTSAIILCLILEILFVSLTAYLFLRSMKNTPPLELLQERAKMSGKAGVLLQNPDGSVTAFVPAELDMKKISAADEYKPKKNYGTVRHTASYIFRHMRRAAGKTAVSFILASVLAAGVGSFTLAKLTYQDAYYELGVKGDASDFLFSLVSELSISSLVKDFYCYDNFGARIEGIEKNIPMTVTNDLVRNMGDGCSVDFAKGYDFSNFEGMAQVCLVGEDLAEKFDISPGDDIGLLSDILYTTLKEQAQEDVTAYKSYKVIGVAKSDDVNISGKIFTGINTDLTELFSGDFSVERCEFTLADNDRLDELEELLQSMDERSAWVSPNVFHHVDSGGLSDTMSLS